LALALFCSCSLSLSFTLTLSLSLSLSLSPPLSLFFCLPFFLSRACARALFLSLSLSLFLFSSLSLLLSVFFLSCSVDLDHEPCDALHVYMCDASFMNHITCVHEWVGEDHRPRRSDQHVKERKGGSERKTYFATCPFVCAISLSLILSISHTHNISLSFFLSLLPCLSLSLALSFSLSFSLASDHGPHGVLDVYMWCASFTSHVACVHESIGEVTNQAAVISA